MHSVSNPLRILIVDDFEVFRVGLREVLESEPGMVVVAEAADARSALVEDERTRPDLAIVDVRLPGSDGVSATRELRRRNAERKIALLSGYSDADVVVEGLQ